MMRGKDFLSVADVAAQDVGPLIEVAEAIKRGEASRPLAGKTIALLFEHPSLRTRVSFEVGIRQLGGDCVYLSRDDVGLGVREPVADVARVLDRWVDGVVARVSSHESLELLSANMGVPVVNALSDVEHPCQAISDLLTIKEHRAALAGQRVAFVGDGNNVAASLSLACASVGADLVLAAPPGYRVPAQVWRLANERAAMNGSKVEWVEMPQQAAEGADVVYTDVWTSMGQEEESAQRMEAFQGFRVDEELMGYAKPTPYSCTTCPLTKGRRSPRGCSTIPGPWCSTRRRTASTARRPSFPNCSDRRKATSAHRGESR